MNCLNFVILSESNVRWILRDLFQSLTWIAFFAAIFFAFYYYNQIRNKERMAMIEKGNDLSELYKHRLKKSFYFPWFKLISTILGIGLGGVISILSISYLKRIGFFDHIDEEPFIFLSIIIFGALGMLIGHFIDIHMQKKLKNQQQ